MEWAVATAAFLASTVEFVEAFTIVLVVGVTINWRSALTGTLAAVAALAVIVAIFGTALVQYVPIDVLRMVVGIILILFGLKWLKKAILRYSGWKALHDEEAIFEETMADLRARGETITPRLHPFAIALSFKSVLLEGLEVAFIVITFGSNAASVGNTRIAGITSATAGALVAGLLVILAGILVRSPLKRVPENTLKFIVGIMLTSFGTFWTIEGFNGSWPLSDAFIPVLIVIYLLASFAFVSWLKTLKRNQQSAVRPQAALATETDEVHS
ncbi:MAG TPA: hypothetical protein VL485_12560 [Ktedonobacteraceae bacterium]|jgi:uncharacterized membrane protein|nr:hypothetical protein [Ktedonobacteraceae bacterium]